MLGDRYNEDLNMKIWQIELTNRCNFSCVYCPRTHHMKRDIGVMTEATIDRIAEICSSKWIRLHHYGESLLYPRLVEYAIRQLKRHNIGVELNSNGSATTVKNVKRILDAGLDNLVISWHPLNMRVNDSEAPSDTHIQTLIDNLTSDELRRIEVIRVVDETEIDQAKTEMLPYKLQGLRMKIKRKRNLGQVNGIGPEEFNKDCSFLTEPEFAVLYDGTIVSCCEVYDKRDDWTLGSVFDKHLPGLNPGCSLCKGCIGYGGNTQETEKVEF